MNPRYVVNELSGLTYSHRGSGMMHFWKNPRYPIETGYVTAKKTALTASQIIALRLTSASSPARCRSATRIMEEPWMVRTP